MALFDKDTLEYDTDSLREQSAKLNDIADQLESDRGQLHKDLEELRSTGWQTPAGKAFLEKYDTTWFKQVGTYVTLLRDLADALTMAAKQYDPLTKAYEKIDFE